MTELTAYERDPRLTTLETTLVAVETRDGAPWLALEDTLFYPEGGGQPADAGTIAGQAVLDVQRVEGRILHRVDAAPPLGPVAIELDWTRRLDHMQQHSAQHLLTAIAHDRFGWATTAFHLGETLSDVELDVAALDRAQLGTLEDAVAEAIEAAHPITPRRVSPEEYEKLAVRTRGLPDGLESIRLVEIEGHDLNTCGGTHVASTAEIGGIKLLHTESLRGGTRVYFVAGQRLRRRLATHEARNARLREVLGVADDELPDNAAGKVAQLKALLRREKSLTAALGKAVAAELAAQPEARVARYWPEHDMAFLQQVARQALAAAPDKTLVLSAGERGQGVFLVAAGAEAETDVRALGATVAETLEGRGGGSGTQYQGKAARPDKLDRLSV